MLKNLATIVSNKLEMEHKTVIGIWNANGFPHRLHELKLFLTMYDIDILLLSETHLATKHHIKIPEYTIYDTKHHQAVHMEIPQ